MTGSTAIDEVLQEVHLLLLSQLNNLHVLLSKSEDNTLGLFVLMFICVQDISKSCGWIGIKFSGKFILILVLIG